MLILVNLHFVIYMSDVLLLCDTPYFGPYLPTVLDFYGGPTLVILNLKSLIRFPTNWAS